MTLPSPAEPNAVAPPRRRRRWPIAVGVVAGLVVVAVGGSMVTPTSYYRLAPGSVRTTEDLIAVDGSVVYDDDLGVIGYTTIEMGPATVFEAFMGWIDPHTELLTREEALGDRDPDENRQINLQLMDSSKQLAAAVALSELGFEVDTSGTGAIVLEILPGSAADGVLAVGDTVVAVDDRPVTSNDELGDALAGSEPDDTVRLRVERPTDLTAPEGSTTVPAVTVPVDGESGRPVARPDGAPHATVEVFDLDVVLGAAEEDPTVPRLGVSTVTRDFQYLLPFDVTIDSGSVGGPSAGLAFTLGVIDVLTPGPLTGDKRVATTGTISFDGTVGPVGGVHQKTVAVRQAGADVFLVPPDEYAEASRWAGDDLEVIAVANVDEALAALDRVGGDTSGVRELQLANGPAD